MGLKRKKTGVFILSIFVVAVVAVTTLYFMNAFGNYGTFLKGTTVNGIDISDMTVNEAENAIQNAIAHYQLTVQFAEGKKVYSAKDLGLILQNGNQLKDLLREQKKSVADTATKAELQLTAQNSIVCQSKDWEKQIAKLPELTSHAGTESKNAWLKYDKENDRFRIAPETIGGTISASDLIKAIKKESSVLNSSLNAASYGLYDGKKIRVKDSSKMKKALETANKKLNLSLTYTYEVKSADIHGKEKIDKSLLTDWLYVDEDGASVEVDSNQLQEYVSDMYDLYSVKEGSTSKFVTSVGTYVDVNVPAADETVDTDALYHDIMNCVGKLTSGKRKAPYASTTAGVKGTTDLGGTYVEVDLDHQHLYLYAKGKRIAEGDICSGCVADESATPVGLYTIKSMDHDRYLRGPDYCDWVSYFMPFNGGYGLHDSTWRTEEDYGNDVYLKAGSHGCINMPLKLAKAIYQHVDVGNYVILYGGVPNPTRSAQTINGTSYYTIGVGSGSFRLDASTTGNGTLSYSSSNTSVATVDQSGNVYVKGAGTAVITIVASRTDAYARATKRVTVTVHGSGTTSSQYSNSSASDNQSSTTQRSQSSSQSRSSSSSKKKSSSKKSSSQNSSSSKEENQTSTQTTEIKKEENTSDQSEENGVSGGEAETGSNNTEIMDTP